MRGILANIALVGAIVFSTYYVRNMQTQNQDSQRILETVKLGGYELGNDPDKAKMCNGITEDEISLSVEDREDFQDGINGYFGSIRENIQTALEKSAADGGGTKGIEDEAQNIANGVIGSLFVNTLLWVLFPWTFLIMCFYCLCCSCCGDPCCVKKREPGEKKHYMFWCIFGSAVGCLLITAILALVWIIFSSSFFGGIDYAKCGVQSMYGDIKYGASWKNAVNTTETEYFLGVNGVLYLIDQSFSLIESLTDITVPAAVNDLKSDSQTLQTNSDNLYNRYKGVTTISCLIDGTKSYEPSIVSLISPQSGKSPIQLEVDAFVSAAKNIASAFDIVDSFKTQGKVAIDAAKTAVQPLKDTINDLDTQVSKIKKNVIEDSQSDSVKSFGVLAVYGIGGFVIITALTATILIVLSMLLNTCRCCTGFLNRIFMIETLTFSLFVNFFASFCCILGAILANACYLINEVLNNKELMLKIVPKDQQKYLITCGYDDSTGAIGDLLPVDTSNLGAMSDVESLMNGKRIYADHRN